VRGSHIQLHLSNSDYQRLNHVDSVTASRELRGLVQSGLVEQHSTRRWVYYTLAVSAGVEPLAQAPALSVEDQVIAYVAAHGSITNGQCRESLHLGYRQASYLLQRMHRHGKLQRQGTGRWTRYTLP
jgi:predicted HTH transcriptional regulator